MARKKLSPLLKQHRARVKQEARTILKMAANDAVNFFTENFRRQGFLDRSLKKWRKRKGNVDPGRGILIGKANTKGVRLSRSIARSRLTNTRAVIGIKGRASVYAGVHNFGLRAGRGKGFQMPKRQFMGRSVVLDKKIKRLIKKRIKKIF